MSDSAELRAQQMESILNVTRSAVAAFDLNHKLSFLNVAEQQVFARSEENVVLGQTAEEYLAHNTWYSMNHEELDIQSLPIMRALNNGEEIFDERMIVEREDGEHRYVVQNARALMVDGEQQGAVSLTLDFTDEREMPDENYTTLLENAVRRSRMIVDIVMEINDNTSALDLDKMTEFAIQRVAREFKAESGMLWILDGNEQLQLRGVYNSECEFAPEGYPLEAFEFAHEALQQNQPIVVDSDDLRAPEAIVQCVGDSKSVLVIPLRIRGDRVGIAYLCISDRYTLNQSDRLFVSVWGRQCAQGIEVAQLFEQIEAANERLVTVIDQMPQAVLLVDAASEEVRIANSGAETLFGRDFDDPVSVHDIPMTDSDGQELTGSRHPLLKVMNHGERIMAETALVPLEDGTVNEVVGNHVPFRDARNAVTGGISVLQNRSDFASMDRARDEFLSVVGHELRNPLTSLRGNLQLLERRTRKREDESSEADLRRIGIAIQEADRIGDLVTRVLDVSRVGLDRLDIQPEPCDAARLVRETADAAQARRPGRKVTCTTPDSVQVEWDAARILQVLSNLTQNADRYAEDSPLEIHLTKNGPELIRIAVRDHGPGISEDVRGRLFSQYYRFDDGADDSMKIMTDGSRGLGIGLYVSARIVRNHGGWMSVNNAEGGGAEFVLHLPVFAKPGIRPTAAPLQTADD